MFEQKNYSSKRPRGIRILLFITIFIVIAAGLSWLIMFLWNSILSDVAGVKPLNFWKAAGILILSKIIFGGFRRRRTSWRHSKRHEWKRKWMEMNSEERKEAKARWKEHCKKRAAKEE